ncbi:MAG: class I SAM-dependent methyltransferase [Bryobacteraceae bacterium]
MNPSSAAPSPALLMDTLFSFQRTHALKAAIDFDIFSGIAEGANTAPILAGRCATSEKGMRVLCDFMTINGFLTKSGEVYALTQDSNIFLNRHSPAYMGSVANFLVSPDLIRHFQNLPEVIRKGGSLEEGGTVSYDNPVWVLFARSMAPMMIMPAEAIARAVGAPEGKPMRVLDLAAGHGMFGITIARHNPNAQITAIDWPNVLDVAEENAERAGVANRLTKQPGDAFTLPFGGPYDVVLITNFLHHFDIPTCDKFLAKVYAALSPGGCAVVLDMVPNDDRVTPPMAASFAMVMLGSTPSGDAYTWTEYQGMFNRSGFKTWEKQDQPGAPQSILLAYK